MISIFQLEQIVADALPEERAYVRSVARALIAGGALPRGKRGRGDTGDAVATTKRAGILLLAAAASGRLDRRGAAVALDLVLALDQAEWRRDWLSAEGVDNAFKFISTRADDSLDGRRAMGLPDKAVFGDSLWAYLTNPSIPKGGSLLDILVGITIGRRDNLFFAEIKIRDVFYAFESDADKPRYLTSYFDRSFDSGLPTPRFGKFPKTTVEISPRVIASISAALRDDSNGGGATLRAE